MTQRHAPMVVKEVVKEEELEEVVKEVVQTAQKTVEVPQFVHVDHHTHVEVHNQGHVQTVTPQMMQKLAGNRVYKHGMEPSDHRRLWFMVCVWIG